MSDVWEISQIITYLLMKYRFSTQKPEAFSIELFPLPQKGDNSRFFCGSGTTGAVAEKLGDVGLWPTSVGMPSTPLGKGS